MSCVGTAKNGRTCSQGCRPRARAVGGQRPKHPARPRTPIAADLRKRARYDPSPALRAAILAPEPASGRPWVDFFLAPGEGLLVNEIDALPGFTSIVIYPKLWEASRGRDA